MKASILKLAVLFFRLVISAGVFTAKAEILEEGTGIIYGDDHAFSLKAPKGWVLDNESGVNQNIHAGFYPKGGTWADSVMIAYARSRTKDAKVSNAEQAAQAVVEDFRANGSSKIQSQKMKTLKTDSGRDAVIYHFTGDEFGNTEAVAYFVEEKTVNFVVLTSRSRKAFDEAQETFEFLVKSYKFIGDSVSTSTPESSKEPAKPEKDGKAPK